MSTWSPNAGNAFEAKLAAHPALAAAFANVAAATAGVREIGAARRPQLAAGLNAGGSYEAGDLTPGASASLTLTQLLTDGGQTDAALDRARIEVLQAKLELAITGDGLIESLLSAEIARDAAERTIRVIRGHLADYQRRAPQIEAAFARGVLTNSEMIEIRSAKTQIEGQQLSAELVVMRSESTIASVLGDDPAGRAAWAELRRLYHASSGLRPDQAPGYRASAIAAGADRFAALRRAAESARRPRAALEVRVASPLTDPTAVSAVAGLNVAWTVFDSGATAARVEALERQRDAEIHAGAALEREIAATEADWRALASQADRRRALLRERLRLSRQRLTELEGLLVAGRGGVASIAQEILAGAQAEVELVDLEAELKRGRLAAFTARGGACALVDVCDLFDQVPTE